MKKIASILVFALFLGIALSSCRTTKPPCPAYSSNQSVNTTQMTVAR